MDRSKWFRVISSVLVSCLPKEERPCRLFKTPIPDPTCVAQVALAEQVAFDFKLLVKLPLRGWGAVFNLPPSLT